MQTRGLPVAHAEPVPLPLTTDPCERADAARNRLRILRAAEELVEEHGPANVSMDAVAAAAGVGKGTVFRRFGDRAGLMFALLDERERELQEELIRGAPPLGPGAPPVERLVAFGRRVGEHLEVNGDLVLAAESGPGRAYVEQPVHTFYRAHVASLVREADPGTDAEFLTEALLAPLHAGLVLYLRRRRGFSAERIADGYAHLVRRLLR